MNESAPEQPTLSQFLLGVFIVGQLLFLGTANVLNFWQLGHPPLAGPLSAEAKPSHFEQLDDFARGARLFCDGWSRLTLQREIWGLFAEFPPRGPFATVRLTYHRDAASALPAAVELYSPLEPVDPNHFLNLNLPHDRFLHYELFLWGAHWPKEPRTPRGESEIDRYLRVELARANWKPALAYMRWQIRRYQGEYSSEPPPDEVEFFFRVYDTPPPDERPWQQQGPVEERLFRWRPDASAAAGDLPIEFFDIRKQQYRPLKSAHE
jgi:hypothetical protein